MSVAALPMYDWPEIRRETDRLWAALREALGARGVEAPPALERGADPWAVWRRPDLALAQTCGHPYAARLSGEVALVGAPAYDVGCAAGAYRSVIVARPGIAARGPADLRGMRFAFNSRDSQSGWRAPSRLIDLDAACAALIETGGHRASIRAVATGRADFAAIDAVAWRLAERHEPAARRVRVAFETAETPGLPFITARRPADEVAHVAAAAEAAIGALDAAARGALLLTGFRRWERGDYAPLAA